MLQTANYFNNDFGSKVSQVVELANVKCASSRCECCTKQEKDKLWVLIILPFETNICLETELETVSASPDKSPSVGSKEDKCKANTTHSSKVISQSESDEIPASNSNIEV